MMGFVLNHYEDTFMGIYSRRTV